MSDIYRANCPFCGETVSSWPVGIAFMMVRVQHGVNPEHSVVLDWDDWTRRRMNGELPLVEWLASIHGRGTSPNTNSPDEGLGMVSGYGEGRETYTTKIPHA